MSSVNPTVSNPKTPPVLEDKSTPQHRIVQGLLTLAILALIAFALIPQITSFEDIGESFAEVTAAELGLLLGLTVISECMKSMAPALLVEKLRWRQSFVADESANAVSNTIPGPSGTAFRYAVYRSWGISAADFGSSTIVNSIVNNLMQLAMPLVAAILLSFQESVPARVWWLVGIGAALVAIALVLIVVIAKSERMARKIGEKLGSWYAWFKGLRKKPVTADVAGGIVKFRGETLTQLREKWFPLLSILIGKYLVLYMILLVSLRSVGITHSMLTAIVIFACYSIARILLMIEITPGGIGYTEIVYVSLLTAASGGKYEPQIIAGVLLFRAYTYLVPILMGGVCYVIWTYKRSWRVDNKVL